jgi:hypothetical protein
MIVIQTPEKQLPAIQSLHELSSQLPLASVPVSIMHLAPLLPQPDTSTRRLTIFEDLREVPMLSERLNCLQWLQ